MKEKSSRIAIVGQGALASALSGLNWGATMNVGAEVASSCEPVMTLMAEEGWPGEQQIPQTPYIATFSLFNSFVISPVFTTSGDGCRNCIASRLLASREEPKLIEQIFGNGTHSKCGRRAQIPPTILYFIASIVQHTILGFVENSVEQPVKKATVIDLETLEIERCSVVVDPSCEWCSKEVVTGTECFPLPIVSVTKSLGRSRKLQELDVIRARLVSPHTGMITKQYRALANDFAVFSVGLPLLGSQEISVGRAFTFDDARTVACLEALERYCGVQKRFRSEVIRESYDTLGVRALDPRTLGIHSEAAYSEPTFPYRRFDPERPYNWVYGYSLLRSERVLVPEILAFYGSKANRDDIPFVYEISNGCAIGATLEEAIAFAIMEVIERDSFLLAWYLQRPLKRLSITELQGPGLKPMLDRIGIYNGFDLTVFDTTTEFGVPSVWAMLANTDTNVFPNTVSSAGAHFTISEAVRGALFELFTSFTHLRNLDVPEKKHACDLASNSLCVRTMKDHALLYAAPNTLDRLKRIMLPGNCEPSMQGRSISAGAMLERPTSLGTLLQRVFDSGTDVIVVDQSCRECKRLGLFCVKVFIPGTVPMTFGYNMPRLCGLNRSGSALEQLIRHESQRSELSSFPEPHPFP